VAMSNDTLRELMQLYVGADFGEVELERLRPLVERHFERMRELQKLDVGGEDPRTMPYMFDRRITP